MFTPKVTVDLRQANAERFFGLPAHPLVDAGADEAVGGFRHMR